MNELSVKNYLSEQLNFSPNDIQKLEIFKNELLSFNLKYNLISKKSEKDVWHRHILDSAQLINFIDFKSDLSLSDLGTGGGFPGIILAIFNKNSKFHVKLYEKSKIKCKFLSSIKQKISIEFSLYENDYQSHKLESSYIVSRAFKKSPQIREISHEKSSKPHKLIILKGKDTQEKIKSAFKGHNHKYRLINSITDKESKIIIAETVK